MAVNNIDTPVYNYTQATVVSTTTKIEGRQPVATCERMKEVQGPATITTWKDTPGSFEGILSSSET